MGSAQPGMIEERTWVNTCAELRMAANIPGGFIQDKTKPLGLMGRVGNR